MTIQKTTTDLSTLKINYLTQEMYDDALENNQINANELYLTPGDGGGGGGASLNSITVTLTTAGWSSNLQTVTATGVTSSNNVIVSPAPTSADEYVGCNVMCTAQAANSLTFSCDFVPSAALTVNVLIG